MAVNAVSERQSLENKYNSARSNLLLIVVFTLINIGLLVTNSNTYFLFSAYIPYGLVDIGMFLCGKYPAEYYSGDFLGMNFLDPSLFTVFLVTAIVILGLYLVSWILSKNNKVGWMIFTLVFFALDTAGMLLFLGFQMDGIVDIIFHGWVIISLAMGIHAGCKLKKLPAEEAERTEPDLLEENDNVEDSPVIRIADPDVKARVLLEHEALGCSITYRRVRRVNELVINGHVYDEMEALVELAHSLKAQINGHQVEVGFDGRVHSYLKIDGQIVKKKVRIY